MDDYQLVGGRFCEAFVDCKTVSPTGIMVLVLYC